MLNNYVAWCQVANKDLSKYKDKKEKRKKGKMPHRDSQQ